ncbi:MAG: PQQ-binding-like beta-propeller repeat protein [Nocardioides sp.]|nr:PQQ-binding-like beta-propeller repeat protein [Nocardioides sp.]
MSPRQLLAGVVPAAMALTLTAAGTGSLHAATPPPSAVPVIKVGPRPATFADLPATSVVADEAVHEVVRSGDRIYAYGNFDHIGRYSGPGRVLDATTGADLPAPVLPDGQVSVSVSDGSGGWYVGGDFDQDSYGGVEGGLQHVLADGSVDPAFDAGADGLVSAMALDGDTLYVGGLFQHVDGTPRQNLAAVSAVDGHLLAFSNDQSQRVREIAAGDGSVYVGSDHVEALDPTTGAELDAFTTPVEGTVTALTLGGGRLYIGTTRLIAADPVTGDKDTDFDVDLDGPEGRHVDVLLYAGDTLYAGGDAGTVAGRPGRLVALDPATGAADASFDPQVDGPDLQDGTPAGVYDLALTGDRLWVGGTFGTAGGQPAGDLAVLDPATGAAANVDLPTFDYPVNAVEASGSGVYVGGKFFLDEPAASAGLAALDATTLEPVPSFHATVPSYGELAVTSNAVYIGWAHFNGYFPHTANPPYYYDTTSTIRAYDPDTGAVDPDRTHRVPDLTGFTTVGDQLVVARRLQDDVRFPQNRITVYGADGSKVKSFVLRPRGYIAYLTAVGGDLLAVGSFRGIPEVYRGTRLAAMVRFSTRGAIRRTFDSSIGGPVYDASAAGRSIYATGLFDHDYYPVVTKIDASSAWNRMRFKPTTFPANGVLLRTTPLGDTVWVSGGVNRFLDSTTGAVVPDPTGGHQEDVDSITRVAGGLVFGSMQYGVNIHGSSWNNLGYVGRVAD